MNPRARVLKHNLNTKMRWTLSISFVTAGVSAQTAVSGCGNLGYQGAAANGRTTACGTVWDDSVSISPFTKTSPWIPMCLNVLNRLYWLLCRPRSSTRAATINTVVSSL